MTQYQVSNIAYDTDGEDIELPTEMIVECDDEQDIADVISDHTGWCVFGFEYEEVSPMDINHGSDPALLRGFDQDEEENRKRRLRALASMHYRDRNLRCRSRAERREVAMMREAAMTAPRIAAKLGLTLREFNKRNYIPDFTKRIRVADRAYTYARYWLPETVRQFEMDDRAVRNSRLTVDPDVVARVQEYLRIHAEQMNEAERLLSQRIA